MKLARRSGMSANEDDRILPLINVVFLLLIFFMLAGNLSAADLFRIEPPLSQSGTGGDPKDVILLVGADGRLALDGSLVEPDALETAVAERLKAATEPEVHVKADSAAEAVAVVAVMEALRRAGATKLRLMTIPGAG